MKKQAKLTSIMSCAVLGISLCAFSAAADDEVPMLDDNDIKTGSESATKTDNRLTEGFFSLGYRWVEGDDFLRTGKYVEDKSSPTLGIKLETFPLPHRFFVHGDYLGPNDYYGDFSYSYSDIFLIRDMLVGVHHNLDHYSYDFPGDPPSVTYEDRSPGDENYVDFMKNNLYIRLKAPNFPFHTFVQHNYLEHDGSIQEQFLVGYFGSLHKTAQSRNIDWKTNDLTLGLNSHLGPIEVEYTHTRYEYDPGGPESSLYDYYAGAFPPGTYPHNVFPEIESSGNTLLMHTSYTGQIVASATLSNASRDNNYSGAEADLWRGAFDLQWMPDPVIGMFFKYRHLTTDRENPERTTIQGIDRQLSYEVREPISTRNDIFSLSARYRPIGKLTLNGTYEFEARQRDDVDEWAVVPEDSDIHRIKLTARTRVMDTLKLKATYEFKHYVNPSYNAEPDNYNKLLLNASYDPASWITALLDYRITLTQRDGLLYLNGENLIEDGDRDGRTDNVLGSVSFVLTPKTSLTASYNYIRWKIEQDLAYSRWSQTGAVADIPYYDRGAPYTDDAHILALSLATKLREDLSLRGGVSYIVADSEYLPDPFYLTAFSSRETTETIVSAAIAKKFMENWEVGLELKAGFYEDEYSGEVYDEEDGELYLSMLTLKRYF